MVLIAMAADKGAPGVTTSAVALAAVWPRPVVLADCDPAGGDLPYRLPAQGGRPLAQDRGIVSLASVVRGQVGPEVVWEHTQQLDGGLPVLVGPTVPEQAAALASAWTPMSGMFAGLADADVIADCGRVMGESPLVPVFRRAELIVLVARDTVEGVAHLRHGLVAIPRAVNVTTAGSGGSVLGRTVVLLVADPRGLGEARRQVGRVLASTPGVGDVPVIGCIAHDEAGARGLSGEWGRRLDRSALIGSARRVAQQLFARVHPGGGLSGAPAGTAADRVLAATSASGGR